MSKTFLCAGGTTGCSHEFRPRPYCDRTPREATSSAKSSQPAALQTNPLRREQAPPRQAARPVGGKGQPVKKVKVRTEETFLGATKTWAGWTTALPSSMCFILLDSLQEKIIFLHFNEYDTTTVLEDGCVWCKNLATFQVNFHSLFRSSRGFMHLRIQREPCGASYR